MTIYTVISQRWDDIEDKSVLEMYDVAASFFTVEGSNLVFFDISNKPIAAFSFWQRVLVKP
jgi:hypothetical protein